MLQPAFFVVRAGLEPSSRLKGNEIRVKGVNSPPDDRNFTSNYFNCDKGRPMDIFVGVPDMNIMEHETGVKNGRKLGKTTCLCRKLRALRQFIAG
jgi:hypothetical protein